MLVPPFPKPDNSLLFWYEVGPFFLSPLPRPHYKIRLLLREPPLLGLPLFSPPLLKEDTPSLGSTGLWESVLPFLEAVDTPFCGKANLPPPPCFFPFFSSKGSCGLAPLPLGSTRTRRPFGGKYSVSILFLFFLFVSFLFFFFFFFFFFFEDQTVPPAKSPDSRQRPPFPMSAFFKEEKPRPKLELFPPQ